MSFELVVRDEKSGQIVSRQRLNARTAVAQDVVCTPPALRFTDDSSLATFRLEHITLNDPSVDPEVTIEGDFTLEGVEKAPHPEHLENGLVKTTRRVTVRYGGHSATKGRLKLRFPAGANSLPVEEGVPLLVAAERSQ